MNDKPQETGSSRAKSGADLQSDRPYFRDCRPYFTRDISQPPVIAHKFDQGKTRMALVPAKIIDAIGQIRTYGTDKYGDPDGWQQVETWRYEDAYMRHLVEWLKDKNSLDPESGLPHLWHMACNLAFLIERSDAMPDKK